MAARRPPRQGRPGSEELARVLAAGHMPDEWSPSKVIRLAAAGE